MMYRQTKSKVLAIFSLSLLVGSLQASDYAKSASALAQQAISYRPFQMAVAAGAAAELNALVSRKSLSLQAFGGLINESLEVTGVDAQGKAVSKRVPCNLGARVGDFAISFKRDVKKSWLSAQLDVQGITLYNVALTAAFWYGVKVLQARLQK